MYLGGEVGSSLHESTPWHARPLAYQAIPCMSLCDSATHSACGTAPMVAIFLRFASGTPSPPPPKAFVCSIIIGSPSLFSGDRGGVACSFRCLAADCD
jgi:hypothetical protein